MVTKECPVKEEVDQLLTVLKELLEDLKREEIKIPPEIVMNGSHNLDTKINGALERLEETKE